ncbi:MAG: YeeE/YedE family protein [Pseudomonadota bacterium]|nr:YeeE/YedE family protein [Pseudomonadota bacterium]
METYYEKKLVSDKLLVLAAAVSLTVIGLLAFFDSGLRTVCLLLIGASLGAVFWAFQFGFSSGWRLFVTGEDSRPILTHLILVGLTTVLVIPTLEYLNADPGAIAPISFSLPAGACLFGIGMQFANGCGSGTLCALGGGSGRMIIVLPFFIFGSLLGSFILPHALSLGGFEAIIIGDGLDIGGRIFLNLMIITVVALIISYWTHLRGQKFSISLNTLLGTTLIAILCWLCVIFSGHPWGITFGFTLWGAKLWLLFGGDLTMFQFWNWDGPARALNNSILSDISSIMNLGMIFGALFLSSYIRHNKYYSWPSLDELVFSSIGGLLMGIGARLAFGCNIGAFLGGVSSGSLHGWIWFACALFGSWCGIRLQNSFK